MSRSRMKSGAVKDHGHSCKSYLTHCFLCRYLLLLVSKGDILHSDDGGSKCLRNVGRFLREYTAQHPRGQSSSYSQP
jgi:hypothetical protein